MSLRMASPVRRQQSSFLQFRKRVPADVQRLARGKEAFFLLGGDPERGTLVQATVGSEITFSLRTRDPVEAKARMAQASAQLARFFEAVRSEPRSLSHRQIVALSGEVYRLYTDRFSENPGRPEDWAVFKAFNRAAREGRLLGVSKINAGFQNNDDTIAAALGSDLTAGINALPHDPATQPTAIMDIRFGDLADWVLSQHGITVDSDTRSRLLIEVDRAVTDAAWQLKRNASGNYSPDPNASRFPRLELDQVTITGVADRWKRERNPSRSTVTTWNTAFASLKEHLGHEDLTRIGELDVLAWKDRLVTKGLSAKTINDSYLAAAKALFNFAVENKLASANPAAAVRILHRQPAGARRLPYTNEEVGRLLAVAKTDAPVAWRWLIWLSASSGARIGEIAQLWAESIEVIDGVHVMQIRPAPDAGSIKNANSERMVPIHPKLIEEGFLDFVASKKRGPLFYRRSSGDSDKKHASKGVSNHLAAWIRKQGFRDPRKAPNHALRHWWKSAAIAAEIAEGVADHLQGHAYRSEADTYRHYSLKILANAVGAIELPIGSVKQ